MWVRCGKWKATQHNRHLAMQKTTTNLNEDGLNLDGKEEGRCITSRRRARLPGIKKQKKRLGHASLYPHVTNLSDQCPLFVSNSHSTHKPTETLRWSINLGLITQHIADHTTRLKHNGIRSETLVQHFTYKRLKKQIED